LTIVVAAAITPRGIKHASGDAMLKSQRFCGAIEVHFRKQI